MGKMKDLDIDRMNDECNAFEARLTETESELEAKDKQIAELQNKVRAWQDSYEWHDMTIERLLGLLKETRDCINNPSIINEKWPNVHDRIWRN